MNVEHIIQNVNKVTTRENDYIEQKLIELEGNVKTIQDKLLQTINENLTSKFKVDADGVIRMTEYNMRIAVEVDRVMKVWQSEFQNSVLKDFARDMLRLDKFTKDYYETLGIPAQRLASITEKTNIIAAQIGIDKQGNILKGGYLDNLSQNAEVIKDIKNTMIKNVSGNASMKSMVSDMRELIVGNPQTDGRLQKYYRLYANDTYSQAAQANLNFYAEGLGLNEFFIYTGGKVKDTRPFCCQRNGMVWSRERAEKWNGLDWQGKSGNFFSNKGGYNCRHTLRWISRELAEKMGYDNSYNKPCDK